MSTFMKVLLFILLPLLLIGGFVGFLWFRRKKRLSSGPSSSGPSLGAAAPPAPPPAAAPPAAPPAAKPSSSDWLNLLTTVIDAGGKIAGSFVGNPKTA